jgi:hypothetical protein
MEVVSSLKAPKKGNKETKKGSKATINDSSNKLKSTQ